MPPDTTTTTTTTDTDTPNPKTFSELGVDDSFVDALADKGILTAFPIQTLTLPMALDGADVIGQARTGTGKTLAFGLALLQRIDPDGPTPQALVIVPTRELCLQVSEDLKIGAVRGLEVVSIYGGVGYENQVGALQRGAHIVVGTPGRLLDLKQRKDLDLSNVRELVLDEADEMLDMGFLPDVEQLISGCPEDRHTMLFSATMPTEVVRLGRRYMDQPTFMRADQEEHETAPTVAQYFFQVHRMDKPRILARLLQTPDRGGCFVFVRTKAMADRLVRDLEDLDVRAVAVHGDLRQVSREKNLQKFRDAKADVLVATEVAARGLDVDNVSHVVNYDCPDDEKMYLHRIGRTARAGSKGVAITFAQFNETERMNLIRKALGQVDEPVREVFSTSDELTELFDLPAATPWQRTGSMSIAPQSDLPIGKVAGTGPSKTNGGGSRERSRARNESQGGKKETSGTRGGNRASSGGPTHESTRATERTRTRERSRTREQGDDSDRTDTSLPQDTSSRRSDRSPSRARDKSSSGRKRGERTSQSESRSRGKGQPSSGKSSNGSRRRARPTVEEARGTGQPRPRRRVQVENLP